MSQDYTMTIASKTTTTETIERIGSVAAWWTESFKGAARRPGDAFSVRFGETFVDFKVLQVSGARIVWRATDCRLHWIQNETEWKDTEIVWDVFEQDGTTKVRMTHRGLVPGAECYDDCQRGWSFYVGESLQKLLADGQGLPDGEGEKRRT